MLRTTRKSFASSFAKRAERSPNGAGPRPPNADNLTLGSLTAQDADRTCVPPTHLTSGQLRLKDTSLGQTPTPCTGAHSVNDVRSMGPMLPPHEALECAAGIRLVPPAGRRLIDH